MPVAMPRGTVSAHRRRLEPDGPADRLAMITDRRPARGWWVLGRVAGVTTLVVWLGIGPVGLGRAQAWPARSVAIAEPPQPAHQPPPQPKAHSVPSPSPSPSTSRAPPAPSDATTALERARAAYEYGDIDEMVEFARQVAEGRLRPSPAQRASALRYLGIGLFLTGRAEGAETAFFELLRLRPESRLDPQTTRPDAVAFFEQVRLRYAEPLRAAARASNRKTFAWNLLPPAGQFQNGYTARAITIGGIELAALGTAITSFVLLKRWEGPNHTFPGREDQASAARIVNWTSVGVLCAAFIVGVIDGIAHYSEPQDDSPNTTMTPPITTTADAVASPPGGEPRLPPMREGFTLDF